MFQQGVTLKELLENPDLLNPPKYTDKVVNREKKQNDCSGSDMVAAHSAFLGPNIWDKTVPYTEDFNLEYMDLDEFLNENCSGEAKAGSSSSSSSPPAHLQPQGVAMSPEPPGPLTLSPMHQPFLPQLPLSLGQLSPVLSPSMSPSTASSKPASPAITTQPLPKPQSELVKILSRPIPLQQQQQQGPPPSPAPSSSSSTGETSSSMQRQVDYDYDDEDNNGREDGQTTYSALFSPNNIALGQGEGQEDFDPRKRQFSEEELRPQPMIKKSRKIYVAEDMKDDRYWCRRKKNNTAAKRSRDARRVKENQIALRAGFLEQESNDMRDELAATKEENVKLRLRLAKYEGGNG